MAITRRIAVEFDRLVIVEVDRAAGILKKRAETVTEAARLRHEAQVLEVARHPGVVELLAAGEAEMTLRLVDGEPLSVPTARAGDAMVAMAVAAATALADLHDLGVVHGAITAEHIVIDRRGRPVFCSFGDGAAGHGPDTRAAYRDVVALAQTLVAAARDDPVARRIGSAATALEHAAAPARRLANRLAGPPPTHPTRRLRGHRRAVVPRVRRAAGPEPRCPPTAPTRRRRRVVGAATAAMAAATATAIVAVVLLSPAARRPRAAAPPAVAPQCPAVDEGCRPILQTAGVVDTPDGRYRIGQPGDQIVVGRWHCAGALPALLRPATGDVWVWDSWAGSAGALPGRLLTRIPDARSVAVDPGPSGCDQLLVRRNSGGVVAIRPAEAA